MSQINPQQASNRDFPTDPTLIREPTPAVTRIRKRAVLITFFLICVLGMIVLTTGFSSNTPTRQNTGNDEASIRPNGASDVVNGWPGDYSFDVRQASRNITYDGLTRTVVVSQPPTPASQPVARGLDPAIAEQLRELADLKRKLLDAQKREAELAADSPLIFASIKPNRPAELNWPTTMPSWRGANNGATNNANNSLAVGNGSSESVPSGAVRRQIEQELFFSKAANVEPYLDKPLLAPLSKYELKAGSVIPAALLTSINTDLPGEVIAQVTERVYDSQTGDILLIPQGSRLLGTYHSLVSNGQNRVLLAWKRLIYPDGHSISLDGMPGTDASGSAGLADHVDYHLDKLSLATALSTALAAGGNLAHNSKSSSRNGDTIGDSVAQEANRVGDKIINRELDVQPTITVRSGWPLHVLVTKDMVLAPYTDDAQHP